MLISVLAQNEWQNQTSVVLNEWLSQEKDQGLEGRTNLAMLFALLEPLSVVLALPLALLRLSLLANAPGG